MASEQIVTERNIARGSADDMLDAQWRELQSGGANEPRMKFAMGYLFAIYQLGGVDDVGHEGWRARFQRCPDGGPTASHEPLSWCAYCGTIERESGVVAAPVEDAK